MQKAIPRECVRRIRLQAQRGSREKNSNTHLEISELVINAYLKVNLQYIALKVNFGIYSEKAFFSPERLSSMYRVST